MSPSESSDDEPSLYSQRNEWADIIPIPQHENITPVAPIFYTDEYRDATSYFRGVVKANEHSQRVLELTLHIINLNPAHYTAWQYRWTTLLALYGDNKSALLAEQTVMEDLAVRFLKTYQVWHHRRLLLIQLKNPLPELLFISNALQHDAKNYHTWAYRQWILNHFSDEFDDQVWEGEISFTETMLEEDVRNNSAWHHRFFIVWHPSSHANKGETLRRELRFVKTKIALAPSNLSAWNYLRGLLNHTSTPLYSRSNLLFAEPYTKSSLTPGAGRSGGAIDLDNPGPGQSAELPCAYAVEFMADALASRCAETNSEEERKVSEAQAIQFYKSLAADLDPMRKQYWNYRTAQLRQVDQLQAQS